MEQYNVKILPGAQNDLKNIVDYLNTLSPKSAVQYYNLIVEKVGTLRDFPERCALAKDTYLRLRGYRLLHVKNYIVFFVIDGDTVEIRRILYSRRQYNELL